WTPTTSATGYAAVAFDPATVSVAAGGQATVSVTITADATLADGSLFGGYLVLTPRGDGSVIRVPYAGYKGDYQAIQVLTPTSNGYPWLAKKNGASFEDQREGATFTLKNGDVPYIV